MVGAKIIDCLKKTFVDYVNNDSDEKSYIKIDLKNFTNIENIDIINMTTKKTVNMDFVKKNQDLIYSFNGISFSGSKLNEFYNNLSNIDKNDRKGLEGCVLVPVKGTGTFNAKQPMPVERLYGAEVLTNGIIIVDNNKPKIKYEGSKILTKRSFDHQVYFVANGIQ